MRQRDSQRTKVYHAEDVLSPLSIMFESVNDMQKYINNIINTSKFKNRFKLNKRVVISDGRRRRRPCCVNYFYEYVLKMPKWSRKDYILLHELAHAVTEGKFASHGSQFCANYLYLVDNFMKDGSSAYLVDSFKEHGVLFSL